MTSPFSPIIAGFECGLVNGDHNLLETTRHLPSQRMRQHYEIAKAHGMTTVRDGLRRGEGPYARMEVAKECGVQVIWDAIHFHDFVGRDLAHDMGVVYAHAHKDTFGADSPFYLCPLNEIETHHWVTGSNDGMGPQIERWHAVADGAQSVLGEQVRFVSSSVINHPDDDWSGIDAIAERCDVIGLNFYPHAVRAPVGHILELAHQRTGKPVMITETGFHAGHPEHHGTKAGWIRMIDREVKLARGYGVPVWGWTLYPMVNCPPWDNRHGQEWDHGLIRQDGTVDEDLSRALMEMKQ